MLGYLGFTEEISVWIKYMDKTIGGIYEVVGLSRYNGVRLNINHGLFWYPPQALGHIKYKQLVF